MGLWSSSRVLKKKWSPQPLYEMICIADSWQEKKCDSQIFVVHITSAAQWQTEARPTTRIVCSFLFAIFSLFSLCVLLPWLTLLLAGSTQVKRALLLCFNLCALQQNICTSSLGRATERTQYALTVHKALQTCTRQNGQLMLIRCRSVAAQWNKYAIKINVHTHSAHLRCGRPGTEPMASRFYSSPFPPCSWLPHFFSGLLDASASALVATLQFALDRNN